MRHHHSDRTPRRAAAEAGFTLAEVIVAVAILGVIIVPIANSVVNSFQVTSATGAALGLSVNRDQLSEQFSNDVAEVNAALDRALAD